MTAPGMQFHIRAGDESPALMIGPGKIALLEAIAQTGSISAAAKLLRMSYRRAWLLVDETNRCLTAPAVYAVAGGTSGGGTALTVAGIELVQRYRDVERVTAAAVHDKLQPLLRAVGVRTRGR
ncbi:MAG: ModE family transcriptional regulator [Casimicrobiaceae bacterium]